MSLSYGSVCSGIEAASIAWEPLGFTPVFFAEIEKFPSAVLARHYGSNMPGEDYSKNGTPNYGDMENFQEWPDHGQNCLQSIDILVGGTPCQTFSIAGLRAGLADPRGNLMLTFGAIKLQKTARMGRDIKRWVIQWQSTSCGCSANVSHWRTMWRWPHEPNIPDHG